MSPPWAHEQGPWCINASETEHHRFTHDWEKVRREKKKGDEQEGDTVLGFEWSKLCLWVSELGDIPQPPGGTYDDTPAWQEYLSKAGEFRERLRSFKSSDSYSRDYPQQVDYAVDLIPAGTDLNLLCPASFPLRLPLCQDLEEGQGERDWFWKTNYAYGLKLQVRDPLRPNDRWTCNPHPVATPTPAPIATPAAQCAVDDGQDVEVSTFKPEVGGEDVITLLAGVDVPEPLSRVLDDISETGYTVGQNIAELYEIQPNYGFMGSYYFHQTRAPGYDDETNQHNDTYDGYDVLGLQAPKTASNELAPPVVVFRSTDKRVGIDSIELGRGGRFKFIGSIPTGWRPDLNLNARIKEWYELSFLDPNIDTNNKIFALNALEFLMRLVPGADGFDQMMQGNTPRERVLGAVYYVGDIASFGVGSKLKIGVKSCQVANAITKTCVVADVMASTAFVSELAAKLYADGRVSLLEGAAGFFATTNLTLATGKFLRAKTINLQYDWLKEKFFIDPLESASLNASVQRLTGVNPKDGISWQMLQASLSWLDDQGRRFNPVAGTLLRKFQRLSSTSNFRRWFQWINSDLPGANQALGCAAQKALQRGTILVGDIHLNEEMLEAFLIALRKIKASGASLERIVVGGDVLDAGKTSGWSDIQRAEYIRDTLLRMADASGVPKASIYFLMGNHDATTRKVEMPEYMKILTGDQSVQRIVTEETGNLFRDKIKAAGLTVATTSPEQLARIGTMVVSHFIANTGELLKKMATYVIKDTGQLNAPDMPVRPLLSPQGVTVQVNFDTHSVGSVVGPSRHAEKGAADSVGNSWSTFSVPTLGGHLSDKEGNFRGFAVLSSDGIPFAFELSPTGLATAKGIPVSVRPELPEDLSKFGRAMQFVFDE